MVNLPSRRRASPAPSPYAQLGFRDLPFPTNPLINPNSDDPRLNGAIFASSSVRDEIAKFEDLLIRPNDFHNRAKLASLWAKSDVEQGRGMGKTALLRHFQRRINDDWGVTQFDGQFYAAVVYVAFPDQVDRRWMEQLAWAALIDTCENGVLDVSRAALRRDLLSDEKVDAILSVGGETRWQNLLDDDIVADHGVDPDNLNVQTERLLLDERVAHAPASYLARGRFEDYLCGLRRDGNLRPYYVQRDTRGLDYSQTLFFNDIVRYLRTAGFEGGYLFIDDIENLTDQMSRRHYPQFAKELSICTVRYGYANSEDSFFSCVLTTHQNSIRALSQAWTDAGLSSFARLDPNSPTSVELPLPTPSQARDILVAHLDYYRIDNSEDGTIKPFTEDAINALIDRGQLPRQLLANAAFTFMHASGKGISPIDVRTVNEALDDNAWPLPTSTITDGLEGVT